MRMKTGTIQNRIYGGIIVGCIIRGTIGLDRIFRYRRGNGYYGSDADTIYQDQYTYFVPISINNPQGEPARIAFRTAVANWQAETTTIKREYNARARARGNKMSGYNLYIGEYVLDNA